MRALYDSKSKSIDDRGIGKILSEQNRLQTWLKVEGALAKAQAEEGYIPRQAADEIGSLHLENLDLEKMAVIKARIGHGFVPFLKVMGEACGEESSKYIHYGVTTQNIQQTSQLYIAKQVYEVWKTFLADILKNLAVLAEENADTVMPGRTHGKHAIPITFGYKVSVWISELLQSVERLEEGEKRVFQVMMGGAVGSFNATGEVGRKVQAQVAKLLDMTAMPVPSRNISTHKQEFVMNLALLCSGIHKMAEEVYYTGLEEFGELSEGFTEGTVGSSTMPQKINPKLAKGIIGNSQKLYSLIPLGLYSGSRMFEGDSSAYMVSDAYLEEAMELTTEVLMRAEELTRTLYVNRERMYENASRNQGLDNSEFVMMKVAEKIGKDQAHSLMYEKAMMAERGGMNYLDALEADPVLCRYFSGTELEEMLKPENYTGLGHELALDMASAAKEYSRKWKG